MPIPIRQILVSFGLCLALCPALWLAVAGPLRAEAGLDARLQAAGPHETLAQLIADTPGARDALEDAGALTLFAPTDEAFRRLPEAFRAALSGPAGAAAREDLLGAHLVRGRHAQDDLPVELDTLGGQRLVARYTDGALTVRLAAPEETTEPDALRVARADAARIRARSSAQPGPLIVHPIDRVLLPDRLDAALAGPEPAAEPASPAGRIAESSDVAGPVVPPETPDPTDTVAPRLPDRDAPEAEVIVLAPAERVAPRAAGAAAEDTGTDPSTGSSASAAEAAGAPTDASAAIGEAGDVSLTRDVTAVSNLIGATAWDGSGSEVGEITDLLMVLGTGRVQTVIVARQTGFLGLGETETQRLPLDALSIDPLEGRLIVDTDSGEDTAR